MQDETSIQKFRAGLRGRLIEPQDDDYAGPMLWELSDTHEMMKWYYRLIKDAPENLNGFFAFLTEKAISLAKGKQVTLGW